MKADFPWWAERDPLVTGRLLELHRLNEPLTSTLERLMQHAAEVDQRMAALQSDATLSEPEARQRAMVNACPGACL